MDAYSSLSKYDADTRIYGYLLLFSPTHSCLGFFFGFSVHLSLPRFLSPTAKKQRVQPGCIQLQEKLSSRGTEKPQVIQDVFFLHSCENPCTHARTHASPRKGYVRVTVGKKGRQVAGRAWKTTGVDFFSAAKQQSPLSAVGPFRTASPRHPHPTYSTWTLCDTLFKSYVT